MSTLRKTFFAAALAVIGAGGLTIAEPTLGFSEAHAVSCQSSYTATGRATNLERAKQRARVKWRAGVRLHYGWQYNNWDQARNRGYNQRRRFGVWIVNAYGQPCNG